MSEQKDYIIHQYEFKPQSEPYITKKNKWMQEIPPNQVLFSAFELKDTTTQKLVNQMDKRLKLAGLSTQSLNEKYNGVVDMYIHLTDLDGITLWASDYFVKDGLHGFNPVGQSMKDYFLKQHPELVVNDLSKYQYINETLPDVADFDLEKATHKGSPALVRCHYERVDTLKGTPLAYMVFIRIEAIKNNVEMDTKRSKSKYSKTEIVAQKFLEFGLNISIVVRQYEGMKTPVLCINLIGRLLWMNTAFKNHFHKGEKDVLEIFSPQYGFEAYEKACELCLQYLPSNYNFKSLQCIRVDGTNQKPMGYFVVFHSVDMDLSNLSKVEQCDQILGRVGLSKKILDEKFAQDDREIVVIGIDGRLLYMNAIFRRLTEKTDDLLNTLFINYIKEVNPHTKDVFDMLLTQDLPKEYIFVAEMQLTNPPRCKKAKFVYVTKQLLNILGSN